MGGEDHKEMLFWTKEEYLRFADVMMDKPVSYYASRLVAKPRFCVCFRSPVKLV
jgi:hypothetical protein